MCDIRLEAILPVEPKRFYPVCTGGKNASPSENFQDVQAYMEHIDQHRYNLPLEAMNVMADALKVIAQTDSNAPVQEVLGDLGAIREAANQIEAYASHPSCFRRRPVNHRLRPSVSWRQRAMKLKVQVVTTDVWSGIDPRIGLY